MRVAARLLFALLLAFAMNRPAGAESLGDADQATIKSMIRSQIEAFQRDDGEAAYGYASPTIRGLFPSVELFMSMVRNGYQPVYRPKSVTFGSIEDSPQGPVQRVYIVGPDGRNWVAIYTLERQPDGSWKINGCTLVEDDGASI